MVKIVVSAYYEDIINTLEKSITKELSNNNINYEISKVAGVWEIPYEINRLTKLSKDNIDFIAVGVVVKGESDHYEYISSSVANALMNLTVNNNIYIANCILNLTDISQANKRSSTKGLEAVNALISVKANRT